MAGDDLFVAGHDTTGFRFCIIAPGAYRATGKIRSGLRIKSTPETGIGKPASAPQQVKIMMIFRTRRCLPNPFLGEP